VKVVVVVEKDREISCCILKLSPGGLRQFTLSPVRDYDRTQELGLTLLGRVPSLLCIHTHQPLVYSYLP